MDAELLEAAEEAVADGRAANVSTWVNEAMRLKLEHDRRLVAAEAFIREYERQYGEITADEMRRAVRRARSRAIVVRPADSESRPRRRRAGSGG